MLGRPGSPSSGKGSTPTPARLQEADNGLTAWPLLQAHFEQTADATRADAAKLRRSAARKENSSSHGPDARERQLVPRSGAVRPARSTPAAAWRVADQCGDAT